MKGAAAGVGNAPRAAIYGAARLAGRIYAAALARGGARLNWRSAVRLRAP